MKKKLSILLVMALTFVMLTACGGGNSTPDAGMNPEDFDDSYMDNVGTGDVVAGTEEEDTVTKEENSKYKYPEFEGKYWLTTSNSQGDTNIREGFYLDGKGKFIKMYTCASYTEIEEFTYEEIFVSEVPNGTEYTFEVYKNGEPMAQEMWVVSQDGKIHIEFPGIPEAHPFDYEVVDEASFYIKLDAQKENVTPTIKYAFEGKNYVMSDENGEQLRVYFDGANMHCTYQDGSVQLIPYSFDGVNTISLTGGYAGTYTYNEAADTLFTYMFNSFDGTTFVRVN